MGILRLVLLLSLAGWCDAALHAARAQAEIVEASAVSLANDGATVPDAWRGLWAMPDCADAQAILYFTPHYLLQAYSGGAAISRIGKVQTGPDYILYETPTDRVMSYVTNDGLLYEQISGLPPDGVLTQPWEIASLAGVSMEYTHCAEIYGVWPYFTEKATIAVDLLDALNGPCTRDPATCPAHIFSHADADKNNRLDYTELRNLTERSASLLSLLAGSEEERLLAGQAQVYAPQIASQIIAGFDHDHNGALSRAEAAKAWSDLPPTLPFRVLRDSYVRLAGHLVFLPPPPRQGGVTPTADDLLRSPETQ